MSARLNLFPSIALHGNLDISVRSVDALAVKAPRDIRDDTSSARRVAIALQRRAQRRRTRRVERRLQTRPLCVCREAYATPFVNHYFRMANARSRSPAFRSCSDVLDSERASVATVPVRKFGLCHFPWRAAVRDRAVLVPSLLHLAVRLCAAFAWRRIEANGH